jgi:hypothetical protein
MKPAGLVLTTIAIAAWSAADLGAQQRGASAPAANQMQVVAVVGCVAAEGQSWVLTNASVPLTAPVGETKVMTGSAITVDRAKTEPAGKERYRLMNMLDEFGVANRKGQRVLVKGLVLGTGKDRRINLVSFEPVAPACH